VFEVVVDGELVHSKKASRRFPERGEIVAALRAR
jgi:selT/selW/selH-like putative selenoprotein